MSMKISPQMRKQIDSLATTTAGKELIAIYSERLQDLLAAVTQVSIDKVEAVRSEARNMSYALSTLTGKKVVLKITFED